MPYVSEKQRRYMHWAKRQGIISPKVVKEFDEASRGMHLPEEAPKHAFWTGFSKEAGGPGSGVSRDNTAAISPHELKQSEVIRIGKRKKLMKELPSEVKEVLVSDITHACQDNYVPSKLNGVLHAMENGELKSKPVDLLLVDGKYHVLDGHHRVMAAKRLGKKTIEARVYREPSEKSASDTAYRLANLAMRRGEFPEAAGYYNALTEDDRNNLLRLMEPADREAFFKDYQTASKRDSDLIASAAEIQGNPKGEDMRSWYLDKEAFERGFFKQASHIAELAGLGTLAIPSIQAARGKPMDEEKARKYELGGLGILAAPSALALGKKILSKGA